MATMRARGQGTPLSDGRWRVVVCRLVDGREIRKSFTAKTQREAQAKARKWLPAHTDDPTFAEFLDRWLGARKDQLAPATYRSYALAAKLMKEQIGGIRVSKLLPRHFETAYVGIAGTRLPKQVRTIMGTALEWARKNRFIEWNPAILSDVPKTKPSAEKPMVTAAALLKIIEATPDASHRALWRFLALTGLRPHKEALPARRDDFYADDSGWWFRVRESKSESGKRDIPIAHDLYNEILSIAGEREVWPGLTPRKLNTLWHEALKAAGVPPTNLYQLRHYFGTRTAQQTEDEVLAVLMGHADKRLAKQYYVRVEKERLRKATE